eukprot:g50966.t1
MSIIVALNVLLVPSFFPSSSWLVLRKPVTAKHLRTHGFLLRVSRDFVSAATSDMSFSSFPSYLSVFSTSSNSFLFNVSPTSAYYYGGGSYCVPPVTAPDPVELVADRVRFPSRGAFVDLLAGLTSDVASMYGTPARVLNFDHPVFTGCAFLPYAKFPAYVGGSRHQYLRVVQLLLRADMVSLPPPSHIFAVNGVFTVPRSDGLLRFIMDVRNTNELFLPPMDPNLPGPDCIAQLDLRPSDEVWAATSDISNFYDCFLLPEWMLPFMALPSVFIAGIGLVHPCMRCLPQGFSCCVSRTVVPLQPVFSAPSSVCKRGAHPFV